MDFTDPQFKVWGKAGGVARAAKLSKRRRSRIARKAAKARWAKKDGHQV